jgi:hypothetical protein
MLQRILYGLARRYRPWSVLQATLGLGILVSAAILILGVALAVQVNTLPAVDAPEGELASTDALLDGLRTSDRAASRLAAAMRPGLFKSAAPLSDRPMADKTIEKIRSQLKLQCILRIQGQLVAYVNVENRGLKKCRVGDCVEDLFTVVNIKEKSVELKIIEHPTVLSL